MPTTHIIGQKTRRNTKYQEENLSKYVYEGTGSSSLSRGVGHFDCTPAMGGNVALAGHNRGNGVAHFAHLKNVKLGDVVTYETAYGVSTYVVSSIDTVSVNDVSGLVQDGTGKLTMYTCKSLRCVYGECGLSDQKVDQQHAQQSASVVHPRLDAERAVKADIGSGCAGAEF